MSKRQHIEPPSYIGQPLICHETGKAFIGEAQGFTTNYARDNEGHVFSDEGVAIREARALLDRTRAYSAYVSADEKRITGWKGNTLGSIISRNPYRLTRLSFTPGRTINAYRVRDIHWQFWHGRGSPGICITLRPMKPPKA